MRVNRPGFRCGGERLPNLVPIQNLDDPRVAIYTRMKERDLAREGDRFVAEGELVVRRMLAAGYQAESVFVAADRLGRIEAELPEGVPVYVAGHGVMNGVLGYKFHSGIMAIGRAKRVGTLAEVAGRWGAERVTVVILPE